MKKSSIIARKHYGSKSLDLTIPVEIREKFNINEGDVFILEIETNQNQTEELTLKYKRIYKQIS